MPTVTPAGTTNDPETVLDDPDGIAGVAISPSATSADDVPVVDVLIRTRVVLATASSGPGFEIVTDTVIELPIWIDVGLACTFEGIRSGLCGTAGA